AARAGACRGRPGPGPVVAGARAAARAGLAGVPAAATRVVAPASTASTAPGAGGNPRLRAFDGRGVAAGAPGTPVVDFLAGRADDRGGARAAVEPAHGEQPATL